MRNVLLATAALTLLSTPALAQSFSDPQWSGSVGYTHLDSGDESLGAVTGRVGAKVSRYLGVEAEGSFGVKDEDVTIAGVDGTLEHEYDAAVYAVGTVPVNPNLELFGRVGYGATSLKADVAGVSATEDGESLNYGAGANWFFDGQNGLRADWTRRDFTDDAGGEIDTYGLSFVRRF